MKVSLFSELSSLILLIMLAVVSCPARTEKPKVTTDEKAEQIIQRAVQAVGGDRYLNVQSIIGRGFFTDFKDGISQIPTKFVDYILYPDKERTEFSGGGVRLIQTNFRDSGWIFDGAAKTLKDQNGGQIEDFRVAMRTSVENLPHQFFRFVHAENKHLSVWNVLQNLARGLQSVTELPGFVMSRADRGTSAEPAAQCAALICSQRPRRDRMHPVSTLH